MTWIGHRGRRVWNPIRADAALATLSAISLEPHVRLLDIGCGPAEILCHLVRRLQGHGLGLDASPFAIHAARRRTRELGLNDAVELRQTRFEVSDFESTRFDWILCHGASHAVAPTLKQALDTCASLLAPGGYLWLGEGFWRRKPDPEYLSFLDCPESALLTPDDWTDRFDASGFELIHARLATTTEWDEYEHGYADNLRGHRAAHPQDDEAIAMGEHIERWQAAYHRWGRETLGFGLFLLRAHSRVGPPSSSKPRQLGPVRASPNTLQ